MAYHMCSREDADYYAFDILSDILSNGRSSRLTRRLVQEQKLFPVSMPISPVHGMPDCCISVESHLLAYLWSKPRLLSGKSWKS
jgi:hypothetical protein